MLNAAVVANGTRNRLPSAGERRNALPFPDPWILIPALLLLALGVGAGVVDGGLSLDPD